MIAKEGTEIPVDIIGSTIKDDNHSVIGIALIFSDIIERKKTEEALRMSKH
ncbi:MAG: PAS domain S-box protein [Bacteroidia bacterium]